MLPALDATSLLVPLVPLAPVLLYLTLVAVVAVLAVLHPERVRRGEARQVLAALLAVLRRRR